MDPAVRKDLKCGKCGKKFEGDVTQLWCAACENLRPAEPVAEAKVEGTVPVFDVQKDPPKTDSIYKKRIHVDPDRKRYDRKPRDEAKLSAARPKAMESIAKEPPDEKARKDPVRAELEEAKRKREAAMALVLDLDGEILKLMQKLAPPEAQGRKSCFGRYDPGDFECESLCPLKPECAEKSGGGGPPKPVFSHAPATKGDE